MNEIMLDLECLDSSSSAAIVSIGAVYFDIQGKVTGDTFYKEISKDGLKFQLDNGSTCSLDTFIWWMHQNEDARSVFKKRENEEKCHIQDVLKEFSEFCKIGNNVKLWGNGVTYDNIVLRNAYRLVDIPCPWQFRNDRCYRTIKGVHGNRAKLERVGTHHNALDDAITQANHLIDMLSKKQ